MTAKHTPGPWATDGNEKTWSLLDPVGRRIALIDKGGLNAAGNARLITAAPELLAVLKELFVIGAVYHGAIEQVDFRTDFVTWAEKAKAIIADAGGYNPKQIAWELERTAMGDGFYGNALVVVRSLVTLTPEELAVVQRFECGSHSGTDHVTLQDIALRVYAEGGANS